MEINYNGVVIDLDEVLAQSGRQSLIQPTKTIEKDFVDIRELYLQNLSGNIHIQPGVTDRALVSITGPANIVDDIEISTDTSDRSDYIVLNICGKRTTSNNVMRFVNDGSINIGGIVDGCSNVIINNHSNTTIISNSAPKVDATITLPRGTNISIEDCPAVIDAGQFHSDALYARIGGRGEIQIQGADKLDIAISGNGKIDVAKVKGDAKLKLSGNGSIQIHDGEIDDLDTSISGCGSVTVAASVQNADLSVSGMGNILVNNVAGRLRKRCSGMGSINVINHH